MNQPNNALIMPIFAAWRPNLLSVLSIQAIFMQLITTILSDSFTAQDRVDFCVLFASCGFFANDEGVHTVFAIMVKKAMGMRRPMTGIGFINIVTIYNTYSGMHPDNRRISRFMTLPSKKHKRTLNFRIVPGGVRNFDRRIMAQPNSVVFRRIGRIMQILRSVLHRCLAVDGALDTLIAYGVFSSNNNRNDALTMIRSLRNLYRLHPVSKWYLAVFDSQRADSLRRLLMYSNHLADVTSFLPTDACRRFNLRSLTGMHWTVNPNDVIDVNHRTGNRGAYLYLCPS